MFRLGRDSKDYLKSWFFVNERSKSDWKADIIRYIKFALAY